jgi:hypothetical protein
VIEILGFPFGSRLDFSGASASDGVLVGSPVALAFLDNSILNERVEVRVEPTMVDLLFVVVLKFVFDRKSVRVIKADNYVSLHKGRARSSFH